MCCSLIIWIISISTNATIGCVACVQSIEYGFNEMGFLNAASADGTVIKVYAPPGMMEVFFYCLFSHGPDRVRSKGSNGKTFLDDENLFFPRPFHRVNLRPE